LLSETKFLCRAPLLDSAQQVLGYRLAWQNQERVPPVPAEVDFHCLQIRVVERSVTSDAGLLFLDAGSVGLSAEILKYLTPASTVLMLAREAFADESARLSVVACRERGFGIGLCDVDLDFLVSDENLLSIATHVEVSGDHPDLLAISRHVKLTQPRVSVVVKNFPDWREFDIGTALGLHGFFADLCRIPRKMDLSSELGPQATMILQLMQMIQDNADVRDLEKVLKCDVTLSYKLFRYINSASFGFETEIGSLRVAVAMMGYSALYRWLSLLLATTSTTGFSPALLQAAIIRGRFTELLGQGFLSKTEAENLFVVGMFSMLEQLLGLSLPRVLQQISLPEAITKALISREGVYGPFLTLAESCEQADGRTSDYADDLFMTSMRVNHAHLEAIAWAKSLGI
jgi:c-di-GMP-related signal transduction protein